jgi:hypothetical protein
LKQKFKKPSDKEVQDKETKQTPHRRSKRIWLFQIRLAGLLGLAFLFLVFMVIWLSLLEFRVEVVEGCLRIMVFDG